MQKSAGPPPQFELLPTSRNLMKKIRSSSKSKNRPIFERDSFRFFFVGLCTRGNNSNYDVYGEADFELGTSRRDCGLVPRSVWCIPSVCRSKTNMYAKKEVYNERDPRRIRPKAVY